MTYNWLPGLLAEVAEAAGLDAALKLADARGGTQAYIPKNLTSEHWLVACVGRPAAEKICAMRGGLRVDVPLGPRGLTGIKGVLRRTVEKMLADGKSETEIALALGITDRTVRSHRARQRQRADDPQGTLL